MSIQAEAALPVAHSLFALCHGLVSLELAQMSPPGDSAEERYGRALDLLLAGLT